MVEKKKRLFGGAGWTILVLVLFTLLVFIIIILSHEKRYEMTTGQSQGVQQSISCSINTFDEAFFILDGASQVEHTIKVLFTGDRASKLFYSYEGKLRSDEDAERGATMMNIKYDEYLGEHNYPSSKKVEEEFRYDKSTVRIEVYTSVEGINSDTATFFFLENDKLNELMKMNADQLGKYYSEKGFKCDYQK